VCVCVWGGGVYVCVRACVRACVFLFVCAYQIHLRPGPVGLTRTHAHARAHARTHSHTGSRVRVRVSARLSDPTLYSPLNPDLTGGREDGVWGVAAVARLHARPVTRVELTLVHESMPQSQLKSWLRSSVEWHGW
jgi:hypothetical protein